MDALEVQNAIMDGAARYLEWRNELLAAWQEGVMKGQLRQVWAMMPAEMKEWLKENDPQGYEQAVSMIESEGE